MSPSPNNTPCHLGLCFRRDLGSTPPALPGTGRPKARWDAEVRQCRKAAQAGAHAQNISHATGLPTWPCFLPRMAEPARCLGVMRPGGQDPALPGNESPRSLVSLGAHGWGSGRDHLHSVFKGQEIPTGRVTSC